MTGRPPGRVTDYGDLLHIETWLVKGRKHFQLIFHVGPTAHTTPADRIPGGW